MDVPKSSSLLATCWPLRLFFASNPHLTYGGEHKVLLNMLRVTLGVAQIFQALWTEFLFLLNFTAPLRFAFHAYHSFSTGSPHWTSPQHFASLEYSWPKLGRQQAPPEGLKQWRKCLHCSVNNLKWNFRYCSQSILCVPNAEKFLKENWLLMLCWSQSLFAHLVYSSPNSQLPVYHSDRLCGSLLFLPPNFPMHSCHAEGTSSSQSNCLFLPERSSALTFKTTLFGLRHSYRDNEATPLKERPCARRAPGCLGDRPWGLRLPSSLGFDGTPESFRVNSNGLF